MSMVKLHIFRTSAQPGGRASATWSIQTQYAGVAATLIRAMLVRIIALKNLP